MIIGTGIGIGFNAGRSGGGAPPEPEASWSDFGTVVASYPADDAELSGTSVTSIPNAENPGTFDMEAGTAPTINADGWDGANPKVTFNGTNQYLVETTGMGGAFDGEDTPMYILGAAETAGSTQYLMVFGNSAADVP